MSEEPAYDGVAFVINNKEPCGFVAVDYVESASENELGDWKYTVQRLAPDGECLKTITLDEEDIDDGLVAYDFPIHDNKHEALEAARGAVPDPEDV